MTRPAQTGSLEMTRTRSAKLLWLALAVVVLVLAGWYATHPRALPTSATPVRASTPVDAAVYVGVLSPTPESGRVLTIRGIDVDPSGDLPVAVDGKICQGGSVVVTTDPEAFCSSLVDAEGESVGPGDTLVLEVVGDQAGEVALGRVRVTYREGLQWGSHEAGPPVTVTFLSR